MTLFRKHATALLAAATYNLIVFFPVLFMGRVLSPNDVFMNFDPWAIHRDTRVQNSLLNDPPTSYFTLMALAKERPEAFHWNPYIGSGIPGWGSSAAAILSPFVILPLLALPLTWVYTGIVFLKINAAFVFACLWLREERLGRRGAGAGAIVVAGASVYAVRFLWQVTNATALYPALLWLVRRAWNGKRVPVSLTAVVALAYALAGFPATMAYGAWIAIAYALFLAVRERRVPLRAAGAAALAVALALLVAAPSIHPLVKFIERSGYLSMREKVTLDGIYPAHHWRSFFDPERLGNPATKSWTGDHALKMNNYVEATVYVGLAAIVFALLAPFHRRARSRWFWIGVTVVILAAIFGAGAVARAVASLPGIRLSPLSRLVLLLPLPAGYFVASGVAFLDARLRRWPAAAAWTAAVVAVAAAADLAVVAGRFHPYLPPEKGAVPSTPTIEYLRAQPQPFRVAPFFDYLWPNAAEMYGIEDIRSHFGSEEAYRRLLQRIDPTSWGGTSTVIQFNSLHFKLTDPLVSMLGVRYFLEQRSIDIVKWSIFAATEAGVADRGPLAMKPGMVFERSVRFDAEPFWAIEVPVFVDKAVGPDSRIAVSLFKYGAAVWERDFHPGDIAAMNKVYIPLRRYAEPGEEVRIRIRSIGIEGSLSTGPAPAGESPVYYGRVKIPVIFDRELPDGRIFENLAEVPRFRVARRVRRMTGEEFLADEAIDLAREAVITEGGVAPPGDSGTDARVRLVRYAADEQHLESEASAPFFLASSEKLTPELRILIDGKEARAVEINTLFAGLQVPAGKHEIVFSRRIGRGWWGIAAAAALALAGIAAFEVVTALRRRCS